MPRCQFLQENFSAKKEDKEENSRCTLLNNISVIVFYDPFNHVFEYAFLCQKHSDLVLAEYMFSYNQESDLIKKLEDRRKEEKKIRTFYETKSIENLYEKIQGHRLNKTNISNKICRSLICNEKILTNQKRFIATAYHANGNLRHYFYFHSRDCMNQLKARCGLLVPILAKQTSLK